MAEMESTTETTTNPVGNGSRKRKSTDVENLDFNGPRTRSRGASKTQRDNCSSPRGPSKGAKSTALKPPGFARRKAKSGPNESSTSSGSGCARTPRSGLKRPQTRSATSRVKEDFGSSIEEIVAETFGSIDERQAVIKTLLRRTKPKQKLFGAAKQYCETETRRLATGIKEMAALREKFILNVQNNDGKRKRHIDSLEVKLGHHESRRKEETEMIKSYSERLHQVGEEVKEKEIQIEKLKLAVSEQSQVVEKTKDSAAKVEAKLKEHQAEKDSIETDYKLKLEALEAQHQKTVEETEGKAQALQKEVEEAKAKSSTLQEEVRTQEKALIEANTKMEAVANDRTRRQSETQSLEKRNQNLEEKLDARDKQLEKALQTFQENQQFSQERIASLTQESKELEAKTKGLEECKANLTAENAQLATDKAAFEERMLKAEQESKEGREQLEEELRRFKAHMEVTLDKLQKELNASKQTFAEREHEFEAQLETLQELYDAEKEKNNSLESELSATQATYQQAGNSSKEQLDKLYAVSKEAEMLKRRLEDIHSVKQSKADVELELKQANEKLFEAEKLARTLRNEIQDLKGTVRVVARLRPFKNGEGSEADDGNTNKVMCDVDDATVHLSLESASNTGNAVRSHDFKFNRSFGPSTTQEQMFQEVSCFIQSAIDGYNVCLFSYGQTGSGKTHTMTGEHFSETNRGIIPRAVEHIMKYKQGLVAQGWRFEFEVTILEIYNETIRDLLDTKAGKKLDVRDSKTEILVPGLERKCVKEAEEINELLLTSQRNRAVAATDANLHSSRSHSVFTLYITGINDERGAEIKGSLSLCDLAGSERLSKSKAQGERLKETQAINKSLSSIADVFSALSKKASHVPYRNSKLTHLLRPCFSGEGKVLMIVNLSSDPQDTNESLCSLRFASHVNQTEVGRAKRNIARSRR